MCIYVLCVYICVYTIVNVYVYVYVREQTTNIFIRRETVRTFPFFRDNIIVRVHVRVRPTF